MRLSKIIIKQNTAIVLKHLSLFEDYLSHRMQSKYKNMRYKNTMSYTTFISNNDLCSDALLDGTKRNAT